MSYDITWIMQVYLGEYEHAPKKHADKFRRAVKSFIRMKDPKTQLIISSDGCDITHEIYQKEFKKHSNIRYVYMDKASPKMYDEYNGELLSEYNRVGPRQIARQLVSGTLTTYLDSDDFLLPNAAETIRKIWLEANRNQPVLWLMNTKWYDNQKVLDFIENENYHTAYNGFSSYATTGEPIKIKGLNSKWIETHLDERHKVGVYAFNMVHDSKINIPWKDTVYGIKGGIKADTSFWKKLKNSGDGFLFQEPYYVRCKFVKLWDY
jgi:hypothetical protein